MVRIVLTMIVRRELEHMNRVISSAKDVIHAVCICNTEGVYDRTSEITEAVCKNLDLPLCLEHQPWKNFSHNRSLSFDTAVKYVKSLGWPLEETYALFLDADMELQVMSDFTHKSLTAVGYHMIQDNGQIEYPNLRLARMDAPWKCVSVTHEYWRQESRPATDTDPGWNELPIPKITTLRIKDLNDGKCKADKFIRDIKLLTEGLKDEPDNVRYMFYLAQSYKDSNQDIEAVKWYKKRIAAGGWAEEVWYSMMTIGDLYLKNRKFSKALEWWLKAFDYRPTRAETLLRLAREYRTRGNNAAAYYFSKIGLSIPYPHHDALFIDKSTYSHAFLYELSIVAYYLGKIQEGLDLSNILLLSRTLPMQDLRCVEQNLEFYLQPLKIVDDIDIKITLPPLVPSDPEIGTFRPMNPSIIQTRDGYLVNVRCVSYRQDKNGVYSYPDKSGVIKTINYLCRYDKNLKLVSQTELVDPKPNTGSTRFLGLEDIRLFTKPSTVSTGGNKKIKADNLMFVASTAVTRDVPQMVIGEISDGQVVSKQLLIGPKGEDSCEKNWMPCVMGSSVYLLYSHEPYIRLRWTPNTPSGVEISDQYRSEANLSGIRGSGSLIPITIQKSQGQQESVWISVVHHVVNRIYTHRFIMYDKKLHPIKISSPFYIYNKGVEYVCSSCLSHDKKYLIMGVGSRDYSAHLVRVDMNTVVGSLQDLVLKAEVRGL